MKFYASIEFKIWCKVLANYFHGTTIPWNPREYLLWQNTVQKSDSLLLLLIQLLTSLMNDVFQLNSMNFQHLHHVVDGVNSSKTMHIASVQPPVQAVTRESA